MVCLMGKAVVTKEEDSKYTTHDYIGDYDEYPKVITCGSLMLYCMVTLKVLNF